MKLERLFGILLILLTKKRVSAKYLANYFEVSIRTIYRDLESMELAGIPIITYAGRDGGVELTDNFKIDKYLFNEEEKKLIIDSLNLRKSLCDDKNIDLLIKKIEKVCDKDKSDEISRTIDILKLSIIRNEMESDTKAKIKLLKKAIDDKNTVKFNYTSYYGESISREVEPIFIRLNNGFWYLYAYCKLRQDFRVFKLTRIKELEATENEFTPRELEDNKSAYITDYNNCEIIVLQFKRSELGKLYDYFAEDEFLEINNETVKVKFKYYKDYNIINFILGFGSAVRIIEPKYLQEELFNEVQKIIYDR